MRAHHAAGKAAEVEKVMVMLSPKQVHALDRVCLGIRQSTGIKMKRSMLIRSLIDGFLQAQPTYEKAESPADIHRIISDATASSGPLNSLASALKRS